MEQMEARLSKVMDERMGAAMDQLSSMMELAVGVVRSRESGDGVGTSTGNNGEAGILNSSQRSAVAKQCRVVSVLVDTDLTVVVLESAVLVLDSALAVLSVELLLVEKIPGDRRIFGFDLQPGKSTRAFIQGRGGDVHWLEDGFCSAIRVCWAQRGVPGTECTSECQGTIRRPLERRLFAASDPNYVSGMEFSVFCPDHRHRQGDRPSL